METRREVELGAHSCVGDSVEHRLRDNGQIEIAHEAFDNLPRVHGLPKLAALCSSHDDERRVWSIAVLDESNLQQVVANALECHVRETRRPLCVLLRSSVLERAGGGVLGGMGDAEAVS